MFPSLQRNGLTSCTCGCSLTSKKEWVWTSSRISWTDKGRVSSERKTYTIQNRVHLTRGLYSEVNKNTHYSWNDTRCPSKVVNIYFPARNNKWPCFDNIKNNWELIYVLCLFLPQKIFIYQMILRLTVLWAVPEIHWVLGLHIESSRLLVNK